MKYLVDTNILSSATAAQPRLDVVEWLDRHSPELALSVVTASEILSGIAKLRREGATAKAARLRDWWATLEHLYADRILPFGLTEARMAGELADRARGNGHAPGFADIAIAATAAAHELTILTRNIRHFGVLGVACLDLFETLPAD
ncbi:PIN domain-containing protein [Pleomorphomonas sp. PLEO]|uniref:PIN domain-containing protein n=1 Tax=Pleomorphomonas sp. PLEO TaxID=3239306 RepID=UPI00351F44C0